MIAPRRASGGSGRASIRASWTENPTGLWTVRIVTFVVIMTAWELYGRSVSRALFAPPSAILDSFYELTVPDPIIVEAFWISSVALLFGYTSAIVVGVLFGLLMGRVRSIEYLLDPYVSFLYGMPSIALIPLLVIWFGIGGRLRVVIVFLSCIFPIIINTMQGVKEVDRNLIDVGRVSTAKERQILRTIVVPATLPYIFTGMEVALAQALVGVIVAEMTAVITGLGGLVIEFANFFRTADMFVPIIVVAAESVTLTTFLRALRGRLMPWQRSTTT